MEDDRQPWQREEFMWTWRKYSSVPHIKLWNGFHTWNIVHENFMVFNNVFVAFVGLNNNTISDLDRYPDPAENANIGAIPDRIGAPLFWTIVYHEEKLSKYWN